MRDQLKAPVRTLVVEKGASGRLDVWLSAVVPGLSRRAAATLIAEGAVAVNGRPVPKSAQVEAGAVVTIHARLPEKNWFPAADASAILTIHYQDASVAAIEKPSGISSVPLSPDERGTLANFAVAAFPGCETVGRRSGDGGLVQRLDFETSGVVLVALSQAVHRDLIAAQRQAEIAKTYLALVQGVPPDAFCVDLPLASVGRKGEKMRAGKHGAPAVTSIQRIEQLGGWSLVAAKIFHGVRHQIRAHLAATGFPIAGDKLYGGGDGGGEGPEGLERLFLHAHQIAFSHPVTQHPLTIVSPLPEALESVLHRLREGL